MFTVASAVLSHVKDVGGRVRPCPASGSPIVASRWHRACWRPAWAGKLQLAQSFEPKWLRSGRGRE
eukprot:8184125-Pyramimonas_sp.AAC.1